jgi:hypothetical protein
MRKTRKPDFINGKIKLNTKTMNTQEIQIVELLNVTRERELKIKENMKEIHNISNVVLIKNIIYMYIYLETTHL